ncbi:MAG: hypothetical protein AAF939_18495, partial [Planctomycetota bacterium]
MIGRKLTDVKVKSVQLYFIPVETRVPLKFGKETLDSVTCARARVIVEDKKGNSKAGWGETPLSVQWVWPSQLSYANRHQSLKQFTKQLANEWLSFSQVGHPLELGHDFLELQLGNVRDHFNRVHRLEEPLPYLASLVAASVFDQAIHDAYGMLHQVDTYQTYQRPWMSRSLGEMLVPAQDSGVKFEGRFPAEYLVANPPTELPVWHLVGGLDPICRSELDGSEPDDGYPVLLEDWIATDGLQCLKIKLRGNDAEWDLDRIIRIGQISLQSNVKALTADFNCTVTHPDYVIDILDRLAKDYPEIYALILYVEQPFPYNLEAERLDVSGVSQKKPLFLDESAHDWRFVKLGKQLGWSGVALKTCKTQTGALLSLCWGKAHGMPMMVQDLTNPMLAQIPHVRLAAHAGTIMGVESNGMQFYPD